MQRPPSRHKDPPLNLGLDLPPEDNNPHVFVLDDSDNEDAFEIGISNANKKKTNNNVSNNINTQNNFFQSIYVNDFMNNQVVNRRRIQTANKKGKTLEFSYNYRLNGWIRVEETHYRF